MTLPRPLTSVLLASLGFGIGLMATLASCGRATNTGSEPGSHPVLVSAAASLSFVMPELVAAFEAKHGDAREVAREVEIIVNTASTGQLCQQIEQGAPVDLILAADRAHVEELAEHGHVVPGTLATYALGHLVLWSDAAEGDQAPLVSDLARLGERRLAIANPRHAPYGVAARSALRALKLWDTTQDQRVLAENVRQALQFAETGDVDYAIVPLALAKRTDGRYTALPRDGYEALAQSLALIRGGLAPVAAGSFRDFLLSSEGRDILAAHGFAPGTGDSTPAPKGARP